MGTRCDTRIIFFLALVFDVSFAAASAAQTTTCPQGTYLHQGGHTGRCEECPDGTFMPWTDHTAKQCFDCTKVEDPTIEIVIKPSDKIYDADIQCVEGYYRRLARNPRDKPSCRKCTSACPEHFFQVHPCENFTDIGCCPGENYDYFLDKSSVRMCRERPWMCRRGQYLDSHLNDCKPCPENTFMPEDYHSHTKCSDCHYLSEADLPLHAELTEPCTSIQPPRYGCKEGFYINHGMSYRGDDIGCSPCQTCDEGKYIGRQCDMDHDTVCCDKPNMTVDDEPQGGHCEETNSNGDNNIVCKQDTYNPPDCDKTCSQHCKLNKRLDVSSCDHNNGTCLFGCLDGYTGSTCDTRQGKGNGSESEERNEKASIYNITVLSITVGVLVILLFIMISCFLLYIKCYKRSGSMWLRGLGLLKRQTAEEVELQSRLKEDHVKENLLTAITKLDKMKVWSSKAGIECLSFIFEISRTHKESLREIGDDLTEHGYIEICMKVVKKMVRNGIAQDDKKQSVVQYIFSAWWRYSRDSSHFAKNLVTNDAVKLMMEVLKRQFFTDNTHKQEKYADLVKASILVLRNIAVHAADISDFSDFKDTKIVEVLMSFTYSQNKSIKVQAMTALAWIMGAEEKDKLRDATGVIKTVVEWIQKAMDDQEDREYEGFRIWELTASLAKLAVNDDNKREIVEAGGLDVLLGILQRDDPLGQAWAVKCMQTLMSDETIRGTIKNSPVLMSALKDLKGRADPDVTDVVDGALRMVQGICEAEISTGEEADIDKYDETRGRNPLHEEFQPVQDMACLSRRNKVNVAWPEVPGPNDLYPTYQEIIYFLRLFSLVVFVFFLLSMQL